MKIVDVIKLTILLIFITLIGCSTCPRETIILEGNVYSNGEWRTIWTVIEKNELNDPKNYLTEEQWELQKKKIRFDKESKENNEVNKTKLDRTKKNPEKTMDKTE